MNRVQRRSPVRIFAAMLVPCLALFGARSAWALGNVTVSVAKGKMSIVADDNPNSIQITPGIGTGAFVVTGLDGTAVNGAPSAAVTDVRKVTVDMKGGQDRVELLAVEVEETVVAKLGTETDAFLMQGGRVRGKLEVKGGKDGDDVTVRGDARVGGKLVITTGKKNDTITVNNASVGGGLRISSGAGNDSITVLFSTFDENEEAVIESGDGADRVELNGADFEDDFELALGNGDDAALVQDCDFDGEIFADGDDGDDELALHGDNSFNLGERRIVRGFEDFD